MMDDDIRLLKINGVMTDDFFYNKLSIKSVQMTASKERILKICEYCGKSFYASKSTTRYCSKQCNSYAYKAAKREEKVKMAETMRHRKASEKSMSEILVKEYLTIQEVAILLGLSRQTIYNMVYSGKLRASKITSRLSLIR